MWEAINKIVDFILRFLSTYVFKKKNKELDFLRERKELRKSQILLLEIFEKNPHTRFSTDEMPDLDSILIRLKVLEEIGFITKDESVWILSDSYLKNFIPRNEG